MLYKCQIRGHSFRKFSWWWSEIWNGLMDRRMSLTHWGRVTHICVNKLTIIGSDNGLSPDRRQAIIWTNAGLLLIGPLGTNFSEILIAILTFSFKKMRFKVSSAKWRLFGLGLNVLKHNAPISWHGHNDLLQFIFIFNTPMKRCREIYPLSILFDLSQHFHEPPQFRPARHPWVLVIKPQLFVVLLLSPLVQATEELGKLISFLHTGWISGGMAQSV